MKADGRVVHLVSFGGSWNIILEGHVIQDKTRGVDVKGGNK